MPQPRTVHKDDLIEVVHGDCLDVLRALPPDSVDAICTDPPYALGYDGGRGWDAALPGAEWAAECLRVLKPGAHLAAFGAPRTWHRLAVAIEDAGFELRDSILWIQGEGMPKSRNLKGDHAGWGTSLKPAVEPCVVARKPFKGTVQANVDAWGTGAINVDAARIPADDRFGGGAKGTSGFAGGYEKGSGFVASDKGRWPANVAVDEAAAREIDAQFRGASKFFYAAKAEKGERVAVDGTTHPAQKPLSLTRWLLRLFVPPGGLVLDTFAGSGTTAEAARREGFRCLAVERDEAYLPLVAARLARQPDGLF